MADYYSFAISSAVPEPATWLTMLVELGAVGLGMCRRTSPDLRRF